MSRIFPVIMCGGSGTRLWPVSKKEAPKQYQAIVTDRSMLGETIARFPQNGLLNCEAPSFVAAVDHLTQIHASCDAVGMSPHKIVLEPCARNTAAVAASIARVIGSDDGESLVLLLPADHHIDDVPAFQKAIASGIDAANSGALVTFGIKPTGPETGYGYIQTGLQTYKSVYAVQQFVEKPDLETAKNYLQSGDYFWNAGIFLFKASAMIKAFEQLAPQILKMSDLAVRDGETDGTVLYLDPKHFSSCESDSIDYAIMEKADNVQIVAPVDIGWSDIGSWDALRERALQLNELKQGASEIVRIDTSNTYINANGTMVAAIDVSDLIIITTEDAVLVAKAGSSQKVKDVVGKLKASGQDHLL